MSRNPFIVLIFGASGSGKTTLLKELVKSNPNFTIHTKGTDRKPKRYDSEEIVCVPEVTDSEYDYIYHQYGYKYGIHRSQITEAVENGKDHFIICNDIETIKDLKHEFGDSVKTIFLLFNAPRSQIKAVQRERGITDDDIDLRLSKIAVLSDLFLDNSYLFDGVVLNKLGAPPNYMVKQIYAILNIINEYKNGSINGLENKVSNIAEIVHIIHDNLFELSKNKHSVVQPGYVFILMAMIEDPLLDDAHSAIKRAASKCGMKADRVDDIAFTDQITDKILGSIRCAEFIVADITHERPNVYYEIGYSHAYNKHTCLIARYGTKPHFDIQGYPIIFYKSSTELENELITFFNKLKCMDE